MHTNQTAIVNNPEYYIGKNMRILVEKRFLIIAMFAGSKNFNNPTTPQKMKQFISATLGFALIGSIAFTIASCKKKDDTTPYTCSTCARTPEALAENDTSSKGIYKGVVIGSSGTIKFNILNGGNTISAVMVIDGDTANLTSNVTWVAGQINTAPFTGTLNGQQVSLEFEVGLGGSDPVVTAVNIPGHPNAVLDVYKETSNAQVVCFEGTFSGPSAGTLNIILSTTLNAWGGAAKDNNKTSVSHFSGSITNNQLNCTNCASGTTISATLSGDEIIDGTWNDGTESGTWSAHKTL